MEKLENQLEPKTCQRGTTDLSIIDIENEVMPMMETMYSESFKFDQARNTENWNRRCALWHRQLSKAKVSKDDVLNALEYINANDDRDKIPTIAKVIAQAEIEKRKRLNKAGTGYRKIVTPEEDCSMEYEEIMKKVDSGKIEITQELHDYLMRLKPYYLLFHGDGWQERYIKRFGKPREEFERL